MVSRANAMNAIFPLIIMIYLATGRPFRIQTELAKHQQGSACEILANAEGKRGI